MIMGAETTVLEPTITVGLLVENLGGSFKSAATVYRRLRRQLDINYDPPRTRRRRSFRDSSSDRRSSRRSEPNRRSLHDVSSSHLNDEESIAACAILLQEHFERGCADLGQRYSIGDIITQAQLQGQIINLQSTIISLYETTHHSKPLPEQLDTLVFAAQAARTISINSLAQQYQRMAATSPPASRNNKMLSLPEPPLPSRGKRRSASMSHELTIRPRADSVLTSTSNTTNLHSSPSSHRNNHLFCSYSLILQDRPSQPLASSFLTGGGNVCPHCSHVIPLTEGKSWEIVKQALRGGPERVFHINNRFLVKCHRSAKSGGGRDNAIGFKGGFTCVICSQQRDGDTVMDSVRGLIDHLWLDHEIRELEKEADIDELLVRDLDTPPGMLL